MPGPSVVSKSMTSCPWVTAQCPADVSGAAGQWLGALMSLPGVPEARPSAPRLVPGELGPSAVPRSMTGRTRTTPAAPGAGRSVLRAPSSPSRGGTLQPVPATPRPAPPRASRPAPPIHAAALGAGGGSERPRRGAFRRASAHVSGGSGGGSAMRWPRGPRGAWRLLPRRSLLAALFLFSLSSSFLYFVYVAPGIGKRRAEARGAGRGHYVLTLETLSNLLPAASGDRGIPGGR